MSCLCPSWSVFLLSSLSFLVRGLFAMSSDDRSPHLAPPDFHSSDRRPSLPFLYVWPSPPTARPSSTLGSLPSPHVDLPRCISLNHSPLVSPESSTGCSTRRSSGQGQTTDHLKDFVLGSDESEALLERGLIVDNRAQMNDLMGWATEAADCGASLLSSHFLNLPSPPLESSSFD